MQAFDVSQLLEERGRTPRAYLEFLRVPAMSAGVYELKAGAEDPQRPHTEDELYYVVRGRGRVRVGAEERGVEPGMVVFVEAGAGHRFFDITEDLALLVVFSPAEYARAPRKADW